MTNDLIERLRTGLGQQYEIEREIGRGGMATVILATDLKHGRKVALKVLHQDTDALSGAARFQREIQIAARLSHPNVLPLLDSGQTGGLSYYVMPYVDGESLRQRLSREGQLSVPEAFRITRAIAAGLAHAHEHALVHRDIKPENILLSGDSVLVADFGIARQAESKENLTSTGLSLGTPNYMSPEQASGVRQLDARADQYALACVVYEMLTGHPPFQGVTWNEVLARHALDPVPPIRSVRPTVPPSAERAIERALAKVPADRFATVTDFVAALPPPNEIEQYATGARPHVPPRRRRGLQPWMLGVGALVLVLAALLAWQAFREPPKTAGERILIAVLPLQNTGDSADAYFADGLSEEITARLTRVQGLGVVARNNSIQYRNNGQSLQDIGRSLGVQYLLEGTVRWAPVEGGGRMVRVTPSLVEVSTGTIIWGQPYDERLADVFNLQTRIAESVVEALQIRIGATELAALRVSATQDPEAYRLYALGRFHWRQRTPDGLIQAVAAFEQAIARDSSYARAWSGLADAYVLFSQYGVPGPGPSEAFDRARIAATRALTLDSTLAEAHASLGEVAIYADWDWAGAERHFQQALSLDSEYATAHHWYAELLTIIGRYEESLKQAREAARLDPTSPVIAHAVTLPLIAQHRWDEAIEQYREVLKLDPTFGYAHIGLTWAYVGKRDLAGTLNQLAAMGDTTALMQAWARAAIDTTKRADARRVAARYTAYLEGLPPILRAPTYEGLGLDDEAIATLEALAETRNFAILGIGFQPIYDRLRPDPRFRALLDRLHLPGR